MYLLYVYIRCSYIEGGRIHLRIYGFKIACAVHYRCGGVSLAGDQRGLHVSPHYHWWNIIIFFSIAAVDCLRPRTALCTFPLWKTFIWTKQTTRWPRDKQFNTYLRLCLFQRQRNGLKKNTIVTYYQWYAGEKNMKIMYIDEA